jgi:phosphinothricin acetyltransferase
VSVEIVPMTAAHWPAVERIYAAGISTGHATFESAPPSWDAFDAGRLPDHRLVALDLDGAVVGWAAASPVSDRCAYVGVIEHSVYVDPAAQHRGIGRALLRALLDDARDKGVWTVQSGIFPENASSLAVHAAAGFRVVGTRERLGRMTYGPRADQWRDVVLVEKRL